MNLRAGFCHVFYSICFLILSGHTSRAQLLLDVETGAAVFGYNDVRIPGNTGTTFSIADDLSSNPVPFVRARLQYTIGKRHSILALYAPLTIKSSGALAQDTYFGDQLFTKGADVRCIWKFNSYRLTYQYNIVAREKFILGLGLTVKIRDAKIALSNSGTSAEKTNLGIVPLLRFYMDWTMAGKLHLLLDGDALVGTQGRAEDILLAFQYAPVDKFRIKAGYRMLEGGADNDEVYNFSMVHYGVIGVSYRFW